MRNVHVAETAEAIKAWEPDTRVCAPGSSGRACGAGRRLAVQRWFPLSFIRLSGGATAQQMLSAGVLETLRGRLGFVRNQVWPDPSGCLPHRPSAISDSGSYPGDSRQPDQSQ